MVPMDREANIRFRLKMIERGYRDTGFARDWWIACSRDPLFYINTVVWTFDPRKPRGFKENPFITYDYQDDAILKIMDCIDNGGDVFNEKSRDMGATWICILCCEFCWHFQPMTSFLWLSRNEDYVDKIGDPKSLFWKLDYIHMKTPRFLLPNDRDSGRKKLHLENMDNGSTIEGESTTSRSGRGDRKTAILLDEFASVEHGYRVLSATADVTRCRIFNSTYEGSGNAFFDVGKWPDVTKLTFHWSMHPEKNVGLYRVDRKTKEITVLDKEWHDNNPGYQFVHEHGYYQGLHSPWYDRECRRRTIIEIKEQLDMDPHGSGAMFFDGPMLDKLIESETTDPYFEGEIEFNSEDDREKVRFVNIDGGMLKLWLMLDGENKLTRPVKAVLSCDIGIGTGASNSTISGYDYVSGYKVLEYVNPYIIPTQLADYAMALGRWLSMGMKPCDLIWEANGPGREFGKRCIDKSYPSMYYKQLEQSEIPKDTDIPGWWSTKENKITLLGTYRQMLIMKKIKNLSRYAVSECRNIIYVKGVPTHSKAVKNDDPSGARDGHADIVISDALGAKMLDMNSFNNLVQEKEPVPEVIPPNCAEARLRERLRLIKRKDDW
jgi:hypothetical protein